MSVYVVENAGLNAVKVGFTGEHDPARFRRKGSLQTGSPLPLITRHFFPGENMDVEADIHQLLKIGGGKGPRSLSGEWFDVAEPATSAFLDGCRRNLSDGIGALRTHVMANLDGIAHPWSIKLALPDGKTLVLPNHWKLCSRCKRKLPYVEAFFGTSVRIPSADRPDKLYDQPRCLDCRFAHTNEAQLRLV